MLPRIAAELGVLVGLGQWLTTIYLLVIGIMVPTTSFWIGKFSTRQLFYTDMFSVILCTAALILAAILYAEQKRQRSKGNGVGGNAARAAEAFLEAALDRKRGVLRLFLFVEMRIN